MHTVVLDRARKRFVDTYHALDTPPLVTLRSLDDGARIAVIYDEQDPRLTRLNLRSPELVELQNRYGDELYGAIYHPPATYGEGSHPTLVWVYGGPQAQLVVNSWLVTVNMRAQYLSELGFLVFALDNRGSARRGLAFEGVIKGDLGHFEVQDQVDGVRWLIDQGLAEDQTNRYLCNPQPGRGSLPVPEDLSVYPEANRY